MSPIACSKRWLSGSTLTIRWWSGGITSLMAVIVARRLSWATMTPFGVPVVPLVKIRSQTSSRLGTGQASTSASQSRRLNRSRGVAGARVERELIDGRRRQAFEPDGARVRRVAPGPEDQVPGFGALDDAVGSRPRDIRRSSGTRMSPARIAPK